VVLFFDLLVVCGLLPDDVHLQHYCVERAQSFGRVNRMDVRIEESQRLHQSQNQGQTACDGLGFGRECADEPCEVLDPLDGVSVDGSSICLIEYLDDSNGFIAEAVAILSDTGDAVVPDMLDSFEVIDVWYERRVILLALLEVGDNRIVQAVLKRASHDSLEQLVVFNFLALGHAHHLLLLELIAAILDVVDFTRREWLC